MNKKIKQIKEKHANISEISLEFESLLSSMDSEFELEKTINNQNQVIHDYYFADRKFQLQWARLAVIEGRFFGTVLNRKKIAYFENEGFSEEDINSKLAIWSKPTDNKDLFFETVKMMIDGRIS